MVLRQITKMEKKPMSIAETLATAKAAAGSKQEVIPAERAQTPTPYVAPGRRLSVTDALTNAKAAVSELLKVSFHGMTIGADTKKLVEKFNAVIDVSELAPCYQIVVGNPPQYFRSYDGQKSVDGRSWETVQAQAKVIDGSAKSNAFVTYEIVLVAEEDVKSVKKEAVVPKGTRIGFTPSYTGVPYFQEFLKAVQAAGGSVETSKANVEITFEQHTKAANNWGTVTFTFKGLVAE